MIHLKGFQIFEKLFSQNFIQNELIGCRSLKILKIKRIKQISKFETKNNIKDTFRINIINQAKKMYMFSHSKEIFMTKFD